MTTKPPKEPEFKIWARKMGFNGKQLGEAHELIGYRPTARLQESATLGENARLAMAAARAGLPPWKPENDAKIASVKTATALEWLASVSAMISEATGISSALKDIIKR